MQYMLLIYGSDEEWAAVPETERERIYNEYMAVAQSPGIRGGAELQPAATATTVRVRDGKTLTTDGPFAETKEFLGGYFLLEAETLDEAIEIAARIPGARFGSVEVRPVVTHGAEVEA